VNSLLIEKVHLIAIHAMQLDPQFTVQRLNSLLTGYSDCNSRNVAIS